MPGSPVEQNLQSVLETRTAGDPDLLFVRFDADGRGWFAERKGEVLQVRVVRDGRTLLEREIGPLGALDEVQDIQFAPDGTAVLARWSGRVHLLFLGRDGFAESETDGIWSTSPTSTTPPRLISWLRTPSPPVALAPAGPISSAREPKYLLAIGSLSLPAGAPTAQPR